MDLTKRRKKKNKDDPTMEDKAGTLDDECKSKQRRRTNPEKGVNTEKGGIPVATPTLTTPPPPSAAAAIITGPKEMTALDEEISKTLTHNEWYHGMMPRDSIEDLLKKDGDFLVRKTDVANADRYAISVYFNKRIRHILLGHEDGM
uniref:SH2 domain-containing protein n=1 Tax=Panagrolaimus sp. ES5 TaxID=591445 RepID=A0AC34GCG8_9BILA